MLGIITGTTIGAIKGHNNGSTFVGATIGAIGGAIVDGVVLIATICIGSAVLTSQEKQNKIKIEANVAESANFAKFTGNAFTVSKDKNQYYVDMFGVAIPEVGKEPTFTQVTYECDKSFYDKAFKYVDINYSYGTSGQLIGAENEYRTPDFWFGGIQREFAESDLLKQLVDITEGEVVSKHFFTSAEHTNKVAGEVAKGNFEVTGIGYVNKDLKNKEASFTIDMIDTTKKSLTYKQLNVEMPLTEEIENDVTNAYKFYSEHFDDCKITSQTLAKENVLSVKGKNGNEYLLELPDEHFEM